MLIILHDFAYINALTLMVQEVHLVIIQQIHVFTDVQMGPMVIGKHRIGIVLQIVHQEHLQMT